MTPTQPTRDLFAWHRALRDANDPEGVGGVVLSRQAIALAFVIGTYMNMDATTPPRHAPGLNTLSAALGYRASDHRKAVSKLLRELQETGYLIVTTRVGRFTPNLYAGAVPATVEPAPGEPAPGEPALVERAPGEPAVAEPAVTERDLDPASAPPLDSACGAKPADAPTSGAAAGYERPSGAAYTPPRTAETAVLTPRNCGIQTAHPSSSFTPPSRDGGGQGEHRSVPDAMSSPTPATRVFIEALQRLPHQEADALIEGMTTLERRLEMARRIEALCHLGAEAKVITELARPYAKARNPAAVAAGRVRALWVGYGRPGTPAVHS